jgi:hypothetical protein
MTARTLESVPGLAYHGPCLICGGPDARHRLCGVWRAMHRAGDSVADIARDYDRYPAWAIRQIVNMTPKQYGDWLRRTRPRKGATK